MFLAYALPLTLQALIPATCYHSCYQTSQKTSQSAHVVREEHTT